MFNFETYLGSGHSKTGSINALKACTQTCRDEEMLVSTDLKQLIVDELPTVQNERHSQHQEYLSDLGRLVYLYDYNRACTVCQEICGPTAKKCRVCKASLLTTAELSSFLCERVDQIRSSQRCQTTMEILAPTFAHVKRGASIELRLVNDDPIFKLPNSYASCKEIVRKLGERLGVVRYRGARHFPVLACDGQPYVLLQKIIRNHIVCPVCKAAVWGIDAFQKHVRSDHIGQAPSPDYEFSWVLLQMGFGHYEMNYMKAAITLFWEDFFRPASFVLNFRSDKAVTAAKKATDTHKAFDLFNILRFAITHELVSEFLDQKTAETRATFENLVKFLESAESRNARNNFDFLRFVLQPLFVFRAGVRRNNAEYVTAGIKLGLPVFFAGRAVNYQQITLLHLITRSLLPAEICKGLSHKDAVRWRMGRGHGLCDGGQKSTS